MNALPILGNPGRTLAPTDRAHAGMVFPGTLGVGAVLPRVPIGVTTLRHSTFLFKVTS